MTATYTLQAALAWAVSDGGAKVIDTPCAIGRCGGPVARIAGRPNAEAREHLRDCGYAYDRSARCWVYRGKGY